MLIGERIRQLRKERSWSQGELGEHVGADAHQISRYETGRIVPSVEALIKLALAFDVSTDYLLVAEAPRRPLKPGDQRLWDRFQEFQGLTDEDRASLLHILDALVAKNKVKALASQLG